MFKEERYIKRTATAYKKQAIIDFLDSINAIPAIKTAAENIEIEKK